MLKRIVLIIMLVSLNGCVVYVTPTQGVVRGDEPSESHERSEHEEERRSVSREILLTLDPVRDHRVDGRYLKRLLHEYHAEGVRAHRVKKYPGSRQVWRLDGLDGDYQLKRLMVKFVREPEIVKAEVFYGEHQLHQEPEVSAPIVRHPPRPAPIIPPPVAARPPHPVVGHPDNDRHEEKPKHFSREIVLTLVPAQAHRVDGRYLKQRLRAYGARGLRMDRVRVFADDKQLWRVDGLDSDQRLRQLMGRLAGEREILKVELYSGNPAMYIPAPVAPTRPVKPPVTPPAPRRFITPPQPAAPKPPAAAAKPEEVETVSIIIGVEQRFARIQPGKLVPGLGKKCLRRGETLSFQRTLANGGHLLVARVKGGEKREEALLGCLKRQPQVSYAEENERRSIR